MSSSNYLFIEVAGREEGKSKEREMDKEEDSGGQIKSEEQIRRTATMQ